MDCVAATGARLLSVARAVAGLLSGTCVVVAGAGLSSADRTVATVANRSIFS